MGTVTKAGLEQPIGEVAINRVPRQNDKTGIGTNQRGFRLYGRFCVTISIPKGVELAQKRLIPNWVLKAAFLFWEPAEL